jgi:hypothetical protein
MGTRNIGPRQAHKKLPHQNAEKTKQMTNMDPTKPTTGEQRCSRMVDIAPSKYFVSNIIARTSYFWWDDDYICFVVDKQTETAIYM